MLEVRRSQLGDPAVFQQAVEAHVEALRAFVHTVGVSRPTAHPLVDAAVTRHSISGGPDEFEANYTIIDDMTLSLDSKKHVLLDRLALAENTAKFKILPQRKMRLATLRFNLAASKLEELRTIRDNEHIASYTRIQNAWRDIELIGAGAESDIDDLTEDNVDSWQLPTFG